MFFASRNHVYTLLQEQASAYLVVDLRKIDNVLCKDHFKFINGDIKHDASFSELCNGMIHIHVYEVNVDIDLYIEFNGCASQFKCICAIYCFASRNIWCIHAYCNTSHAKTNHLGGAVKGYASRKVTSKMFQYVMQKNCMNFEKKK